MEKSNLIVKPDSRLESWSDEVLIDQRNKIQQVWGNEGLKKLFVDIKSKHYIQRLADELKRRNL